MDLVRTFPDLRDLGVAHQPFGPVVPAIAIAAVELDAFGGHLHGEIAGPQFRDRGLHAEIGVTAIHEFRPRNRSSARPEATPLQDRPELN